VNSPKELCIASKVLIMLSHLGLLIIALKILLAMNLMQHRNFRDLLLIFNQEAQPASELS
jgi:hypothetical protein